MRLFVAVVAALAVCTVAFAGDLRIGKRTLVLQDGSTFQKTHSALLASLEERGHDLTFASTSQHGLLLKQYGEYLFDNLLLFTPSTEDFGSLEVADFVDFVDGGGSVLVAVSEDLPDTSVVRQFAAECGVDFDIEGSIVTDHMSYVSSALSADHSTVVSSHYVPSTHVVGDSAAKGGVVFRGLGQAVEDGNIFAVKVLTGSFTSYSADPTKAIDAYPESAGEQTLLVTAIQARNNARVTFVGSAWMLSNEAFETSLDGGQVANNRYFATTLLQWTFQERGVLRVKGISHHRADGSAPEKILNLKERPNLPVSIYPDPEIAPQSDVYRIKDDLLYHIDVELVQEDGSWGPFAADDMQLEFVMLDPYVRTTMTHDTHGRFTATFKAPDTYGIYKFRVMYRRTGLSVLHEETQVSVRPFRHNEYERFIAAAFPYYASTLSIMAGFFIFSAFFLFSK